MTHESWAMHDFFFWHWKFSTGEMEKIVSAFTKAFGKRITIEQAASWLQNIIVSLLPFYVS